MSDPELYSATELQRLTGYARAAEQDAWLTEQGIPFRKRGGELLVRRIVVQALLPQIEAAKITNYILKPDVEVFPAGKYPPGGEAAGVYMLFGEDGRVNYVGHSSGIGYRVIQHLWAHRRGERRRFVEYGFVPVPWDLMEPVEIAHIHAMEPPENIAKPLPTWRRHEEAVEAIRAAWGPKK